MTFSLISKLWGEINEKEKPQRFFPDVARYNFKQNIKVVPKKIYLKK